MHNSNRKTTQKGGFLNNSTVCFMDPIDHKPIQQTSSKIKVVSPAQQIVEQAKSEIDRSSSTSTRTKRRRQSSNRTNVKQRRTVNNPASGKRKKKSGSRKTTGSKKTKTTQKLKQNIGVRKKKVNKKIQKDIFVQFGKNCENKSSNISRSSTKSAFFIYIARTPNRCAVCHLRTNSTINNLHKNLSDIISNQRQWNGIYRQCTCVFA